MHLRYFISTRHDGNMLLRSNLSDPVVVENRARLLASHDVRPEDTTRLSVLYEGDDYCRYATTTIEDKGRGIINQPMPACDALVVRQPGHALLLPIADCIGAVIYDASQHILMVSHLGRHSLEQHGAARSIAYLQDTHRVKPKDLQIILTPSAGKTNYPLFSLGNRSMQEVALQQFVEAGVPAKRITPSGVDTTIDTEYYSHSAYLKQNREDDGRFAVVAYLAE